MSNNDCEQPEHMAIVDKLTRAEADAWLRLQIAELELIAAKRHVIEVTNREGSKRQTRPRLRLVPSGEAPDGGSAT